jgi:protein-disulfide isomerase
VLELILSVRRRVSLPLLSTSAILEFIPGSLLSAAPLLSTKRVETNSAPISFSAPGRGAYNMRRYLPFAIIGAVFLIAIGSGLVLLRWKRPPAAATAPVVPIVPATPTAPVVAAVPTAQETPGKPDLTLPHIRGGANARVTIEEFGDFQCLQCAELLPTLAKVEEDYGERLRVVFRQKPLHKHEHAVIAAYAAEAAGLQGRFWEMHDLLFQNSARWTKGIDTVGTDASPSLRSQSNVLALEAEVRDVFVSYAEMLKLDVERFKKDMDSDEVKARIESDRARADALGIDRTPTLYLNGRLVPAPRRSLDNLRAAIDAELNGKAKEEPAPSAQTATPEQPK